jgi:hypothetical protein
MSENKNESAINFSIDQSTRDAIHKIIANKPFNAVFGITQVISKDTLTEQEANAVINAIGQFPYAEVAEFFANVTKYFVQVENKEEEKTETVTE